MLAKGTMCGIEDRLAVRCRRGDSNNATSPASSSVTIAPTLIAACSINGRHLVFRPVAFGGGMSSTVPSKFNGGLGPILSAL